MPSDSIEFEAALAANREYSEPDGNRSEAMSQPPRHHDDEPETESERRWTNIFIVGFIVGVVATGLWLVDAMLKARQADECMASGRRNCAPIEAPLPPPR